VFCLHKQEAVISTPRAMPPLAHWVEFEAVRAAGSSSSAIVKPRETPWLQAFASLSPKISQ
jgi:hypothetical protein